MNTPRYAQVWIEGYEVYFTSTDPRCPYEWGTWDSIAWTTGLAAAKTCSGV